MKHRGKTIALSTVAVALVVLVGAAIALKDRLCEEWCIYRLKSGDVHARLSAIKELEEKRSVRAVPYLIAMLYKEDLQRLDERNTVSMDGRAAVALIRIGQPAVPLLMEAMHAPGLTGNLLSHVVNIFDGLKKIEEKQDEAQR